MNPFRDTLETILREADKGDLKSLYHQLSTLILQHIEPVWRKGRGGKVACYVSAEFLIGRMIYANLYNLNLLTDVKAAFTRHGLDFALFEEIEDAGLGNGGLGRLAACFLDSAATMDLPLHGYGIRYRYGLFKQTFREGFQEESADDWTRFGDPWSVRRENERVRVDFGDQSVWAVPYDMPIIGYGGNTINTLRLWQAEALSTFDYQKFCEGNTLGAFHAKNAAEIISSVLYPPDADADGKKLRLKQQYFLASASLQDLLRVYKERHGTDFSRLPETYAIQLNDTHPTVAIPELLRLLVAGEGLTFEQAFPLVVNTFSYTNHTIMAEALERWDVGLFCSVLPDVYPYVVMLQHRLSQDLLVKGIRGDAQKPYLLIDEDHRIHMARMAIFATHATNGVAALHTEILKTKALQPWYALYPERFSNKTNGITQRRWLGLCNPKLSAFITERIGDAFLRDLPQLKRLEPYADDVESLRRFAQIKEENKQALAQYVFQRENILINPSSLFVVQSKRLHEYKRQLLTAFCILDLYFRLKDGTLTEFHPTTFLFGAKAASGYFRAKGIIKFIHEVALLVNGDPDVARRLQVVFLPNYNVSLAERMMPAADVSVQISTAGTEASGTGNMKFMVNGAVTLGTFDGANIEIVEQAGAENNYIFGARVEQLHEIEDSYNPKSLYENNSRIRRVLDTLIDGTFDDGRSGMFRELFDSILKGASWHRPDPYYLLLDFEACVESFLEINRDRLHNPVAFTRRCFLNMANAGAFSSDRTVRQYAEEIWGLTPELVHKL